MTNSTLISQIAAVVKITPSKQIIFQGKPIMEPYNFLPLEEIRKEQLIETLQRLIYTTFYVTSSPLVSLLWEEKSKKTWLNALRKANNSRAKWRRGWVIEHVNSDGSVVAKCRQDRRLAKPGEFLLEAMYDSNLRTGRKLKLFFPKEYVEEKGGFYHVLGETFQDEFNETLIRFYFHLRPEAASVLINELTLKLNAARIPFHFKCLQDPGSYNRADVGVLYLSRRYFFEAMPLLWQIYPAVESFLNASVPAFTLPLAKGFAFAESPADDMESFGTHCCKLLATALVEAHQKGITDLSKYILDSLDLPGYGIERLYLMSGSTFPYSFNR